MGGTVSVTIRDKNGVLHKTGRWTNVMPGFINNIKFIEADDDHLKEFLEYWESMRSDWLKYGDTDENPSPMSSCYAQDDNMVCAPCDYGLIVIDYITKTLLTCQGYTDLGYIGLYGLSDINSANAAITAVNSGRVIKAVIEDSKFNPRNATKDEIASWTSINALQTFMADRNKNSIITMTLDMSPWKILDFMSSKSLDKQIFNRMKKEIEKLFPLTEKDKLAWDQYFEEE